MGLFRRLLGGFTGANDDITYTIHGATDKGRVRKGNEDYFLIQLDKKLFIVSDGMGGHNAGEVASLQATRAINRYLSGDLLGRILGDEERIKQEMMAGLNEANRRVREMSRTDKGYRGMGCTVAVALIDGNQLHLCHLGDSRAYLSNRSGIRLLTTDHSLVMSLVADGKMTADEARESPIKNELTQAIGAMPKIEPGYSRHTIAHGDRLLLCSDGLWDMLSDAEIQRALRKHASARAACEALIDQANEAGGKDNITAVVVTYQRGGFIRSYEQ